MKFTPHALAFCFLMICTSALADPAETSEAEAGAEAEAQAVAEVTDQAVSDQEGAAEQLRHKDREVSAVMDESLDGSSVESFVSGLENVDQNATEQEYRSLMSALDFLLFYDLGAKRDKAKLYARLNGKSPNDILNQVAGIKGKKKRK